MASGRFGLLRSSTCGRGSSGYGCGHWGGSAHHGRAHHDSDPHTSGTLAAPVERVATAGAAPLTTAALITAVILMSATLAAPAEHVASASAPDEHLTSAARGATANHVVGDVAVPRPDVVVEPLSQLEDF